MPYFPKRSKRKNIDTNNSINNIANSNVNDKVNSNIDSNVNSIDVNNDINNNVDFDENNEEHLEKISSFKKTLDSHHTINNAKKELYEKHNNAFVKKTLKDFDKKAVLQKNIFVKKNNYYFSIKNFLDDFSFGLANIQFLNIILYLLLPSYFFIGLILSLKTFIKTFFENNYGFFSSAFEKEKFKTYIYGNIIGFSLIFLGIAATFKLKLLYILMFFLIGIFSTLYINGSKKVLKEALPKDKRSHFLKFISYYGLIITSFTIVVAGLILDSYSNINLHLKNNTILVPNYTLMFFLAGILFIISSYMITQVKKVKFLDFEEFNKPFFQKVFFIFKKNYFEYKSFSHPFLKRMLYAGILFFSIQLSFNYILGLYFFEIFNSFFLIALFLSSTILSSFLIPLFFDPKVLRSKGKSLILTLGISLSLFLPLLLTLINTPYFLKFLYPIIPKNVELENFLNGLSLLYFIVATSGASIAGVAFSRLNLDVLRIEERKKFFSVLGFGVNIVSSIFIFIVFLLKELFSFNISFLFVTIIFLIILYFFGKSLNADEEKKYQKSLLEKENF